MNAAGSPLGVAPGASHGPAAARGAPVLAISVGLGEAGRGGKETRRRSGAGGSRAASLSPRPGLQRRGERWKRRSHEVDGCSRHQAVRGARVTASPSGPAPQRPEALPNPARALGTPAERCPLQDVWSGGTEDAGTE